MALIVPVNLSHELPLGTPQRIRTATNESNTGHTDWILVPAKAKFADVVVNLTAASGTTPICLPQLFAAPAGGAPSSYSDSNKTILGGAALTTGMTATGGAATRICIGPGVSGIANALTVGTGGGVDCMVNCSLPRLLGVQVLNDHTTGDETYSYTVDVTFRY